MELTDKILLGTSTLINSNCDETNEVHEINGSSSNEVTN